MASLCSGSEHCESEVREKLQRGGMSPDDIQRIVDYLYEEQYLDNLRYCRAFAHDKLRFARWGRVKIQQALRQKAIPDAAISIALDELSEAEYRRILHDLAQQKERTLKDEDEYTRRGKLIRFLAGRGFTMDEILDSL